MPTFRLLDSDRTQLLANGRSSQNDPDFDPAPVVKLFMPDGPGTWLLTELDPNEPDRAFGLCDLGHGYPELGYVLISDLAVIRGHLRLPIERDAHFEHDKPLSHYTREAAAVGRITA
ncbi:transposase [Methylobacterium sp. Leaf99]|uniref:DUF2958 domain-containing protein n=1 Tax=Methylobacterium sp. Leaf99 TaxID=1736251 RepID=UPI0006F23716|nr:DUF2958 domain-containing protein [Methylobacterium sp. Leaf99]KQP07889.1 transposase [Methylobacterium sp. Leaf99]